MTAPPSTLLPAHTRTDMVLRLHRNLQLVIFKSQLRSQAGMLESCSIRSEEEVEDGTSF